MSGDDAARLIISVDLQDGPAAALRLSGTVLSAVWVQQRDIANGQTLAEFLAECNLPTQRLAQSQSQAVQEQYDANTEAAITAGVFGAPSYCLDGEIFWGQDRLDFVERRLNSDQVNLS